MKNSRAALLEQLAWRVRSREDILNELQRFGWDSDTDHFVIPAAAIINVINLRLNAAISEKELTEWAECFECREDVTYEDGDGNVLSEIVFWLANPEINYQLTDDNLQMMKCRCSAIEDAYQVGTSNGG
jgi:hypothetical protein